VAPDALFPKARGRLQHESSGVDGRWRVGCRLSLAETTAVLHGAPSSCWRCRLGGTPLTSATFVLVRRNSPFNGKLLPAGKLNRTGGRATP
jgi:hypothetical protein